MIEKEGQLYCKQDYGLMFAERCYGCQDPIVDQKLMALEHPWHPDCFQCCNCSQKLQGGFHTDKELGEAEGEAGEAGGGDGDKGGAEREERKQHVFCQPCYQQLFSPRCHVCQV